MKKTINIALFGFGRIGRNIFRLGYDNPNYNFVAVSDFGSSEALHYLLSRDSVHGPFDGTVRVDEEKSSLVINGNPVKIIYASSPAEVNYSDYDIETPLVIDNTGVWRDFDSLSKHIKSNASQVLLTAPGKGDIKNIVYGVNDNTLEDSDQIISAASCTTNAIVPVLKVINDHYGIDGGHIETVHSYTNDQNLIDNFHKGDRRGRGAPLNMVITTTGAVSTGALTTTGITNTGSIVFEGSTADSFETTLGVVDPTTDNTVNIANVGGTLIPFAAASTTAIAATPGTPSSRLPNSTKCPRTPSSLIASTPPLPSAPPPAPAS